MKRVHFVSFIFLISLSFQSFAQEKEPIDYVDVFLGTSNSRWMLGPYTGRPYGMVQLGPDNQNRGWMAGYEYSINNVSGFSHLHAWTMSGLLMMPQVQDPTFKDAPPDCAYRGAGAAYHSRVFKETEKGYPGYYTVELYDSDAKAELTSTDRCGFHKYTFHNDYEDARVMIDLSIPDEYNQKLVDGVIEQTGPRIVSGYSSMKAWTEYVLHYEIRFNKDIQYMVGWTKADGDKPRVSEIKGKDDVAAYVTFDVKRGEAVMAQVGLSLVSREGARKNLDQELAPFGWDFDAAVADARKEWSEVLGRVEVEGGTEENMKKFYTNLYRCYCQKQTWTDVDGKYIDPFEREQQLPAGSEMYGGDAFWNTYWNHNMVYSLLSPTIATNWVNTQLELFDKTGWTNCGPTGIEHTGVMDVTHEIVQMISAWQKGIWKGDEEELYSAVRNVVTQQGTRFPGKEGWAGNMHLDTYLEKGYMPYDVFRTDATMDIAFDFYCVAQMAKKLKKRKDYKDFMAKSEYWKNVFHPDLKYMVPRDSEGNWLEDFNPFSGFSFTEGNSWQYSWYVAHDIKGLIEAMGGNDAFNKRLEEGFEKSVRHDFAAHAFDRARSDAVEYYINHGNEGNMQPAYLFNYSGKPWLTQKYSRAIMDKYYGSTPYHGWEGDEDEGQMGGWFVISAMGLFEMVGGVNPEPVVDLTSPLFEKITIHLDPEYYSGKTFVIEARNNSQENIYIQKATLNGEPIEKPQIPFHKIVEGGVLQYEMGPEPGALWKK